jgi:putative ABC transport system permease protein
MSYSVAQRTNEIGIRLALGAQSRDVLWMVVKQGSVLIGLGLAIGLLGAYAATRVIASLLFGVTAKDPVTFAAVALLLGGVALLACYVPAWRATKVDPMEALRCE